MNTSKNITLKMCNLKIKTATVGCNAAMQAGILYVPVNVCASVRQKRGKQYGVYLNKRKIIRFMFSPFKKK